ncbi:DUF2513 domain-containing protein [Balneatrix alpica]|uniref:DUF2513 domain-containing protein n=1 Tax=Balneatrix alpica TaxID=75684 RepID=A0ABV5ZH06_9GAMM|nr:DUF2513 domain-containing protein [Balneatrix alpica]
MKRNWDIVREILTKMEECSSPGDTLSLSSFDTERAAEISYHAELLLEAGLIDGQMSKTINHGPHGFFLRRLTWSGHEFLDSIRSDSIWKKTKNVFASKGIEMTVDLVKSVATELTNSALKGEIGG